jgi:hypothetical protein
LHFVGNFGAAIFRKVTNDHRFFMDEIRPLGLGSGWSIISRTTQNAPPAPFRPGQVILIVSTDFSGDPAQIIDCRDGEFTLKLYPRIDYVGLRYNPNVPGASVVGPCAAFDPTFFGKQRIPMYRACLNLSDSRQVPALSWQGNIYITGFLYRNFNSDEVERLTPGALTAVEKARFRDHVADFERRIPGFNERMAESLAGADAAPPRAPGLPRIRLFRRE